MVELYLHSSIRHGVLLNELSTGTTLSYLVPLYDTKWCLGQFVKKH
jgi:hypothetical protein